MASIDAFHSIHAKESSPPDLITNAPSLLGVGNSATPLMISVLGQIWTVLVLMMQPLELMFVDGDHTVTTLFGDGAIHSASALCATEGADRLTHLQACSAVRGNTQATLFARQHDKLLAQQASHSSNSAADDHTVTPITQMQASFGDGAPINLYASTPCSNGADQKVLANSDLLAATYPAAVPHCEGAPPLIHPYYSLHVNGPEPMV
ncbi:hypothetical protein F0562_012032 [Nyssa sinensis]|uniref:Uncharacterized protein n=1 Tax=Nyssa sinensis TaxID=561372 RepID=A0A5J4ZTD8_9ASTE|nr:hypothetical protein F0562_012032 [Nyssa sinensis]